MTELPWAAGLAAFEGLGRRSCVGRGETSAWTCNRASGARHGKLGDLQLGGNKEKCKHVNQLCSRYCKYIRAKPHNCTTGSGWFIGYGAGFPYRCHDGFLPKCLRTWSICLCPLYPVGLWSHPHSWQLGMALGNILPLFHSGLSNSAAIALSAVSHSQHASALRIYLVWPSDIRCRYTGHVVLHVPQEPDTSAAC